MRASEYNVASVFLKHVSEYALETAYGNLLIYYEKSYILPQLV